MSTHLAEHLDDVRHDVITDDLSQVRRTTPGLWDLIDYGHPVLLKTA
ncbi:hypothetical protein [Candidatus Roseilinea sp. NK_OTU-006]|jgi:hypothetical protein|nr:hypothetical protein [Candidatus Roseilinea sp. NK_OTU-006]